MYRYITCAGAENSLAAHYYSKAGGKVRLQNLFTKLCSA